MDGESEQTNVAASPQMRAYFASLQTGIDTCYAVANQARRKGLDPEFTVEIPQALDLASRVEQLVGPPGVAPFIRQTTKRIGNRELVSLEIAREIVKGTIFKSPSVEKSLDQAVRTGLAILTEGVLVAPLEGIADVKLGRNTDGTRYVDLYFSGPIRSAGGTGQAMSVLIADVVRRELGIGAYQASTGEIERYKEEIPLYKRVQHLQYVPTVDEIDQIVSHCPICINGEGTEDEEVTGYRDLPRVGTNKLRGGACLVIAEGLCLKAPKIYKHIKKLKLTGWDFLEKFATKSTQTTTQDPNEIPQILPSTKYISEVIAGRPVLSHPSRKGGFRLRYGRARTAGLASTAINPATMHLLDDFITVGTQMKTERPGKGTIGTPCDTIDGPIVLLHNGDLIAVNAIADAPALTDIKQIIDVGELLVPYGEFLENNALLPDASYVTEWWLQDLQNAFGILPEKNTPQAVNEADVKTADKIAADLGHPVDLYHPTPQDALAIADRYHIPLHPNYTIFWHDITADQAAIFRDFILANGTFTTQEPLVLSFPADPAIKSILIELCLLHKQREGRILIETMTQPLLRCLGIQVSGATLASASDYTPPQEKETTIAFTSRLSGLTIRPRAPFRIGTRMGRPEKASPRKMRPPPHVLFPLGNYGGNQRLVKTAADAGTIMVEAGVRLCPTCKKKTFRITCTCGNHTAVLPDQIEKQTINLQEELTRAQDRVGERILPETIKGVMGTISKHKTPEPLEKGILRAKHEVYTFKDGTIRFDMTDAPLTHFKPKELGVPLERIRELGYTKDYLGNELVNTEQICELKVQDVVVSTNCAEYFLQVSHFIDDLLVKFYGLERFYKLRKQQDIVGHLVVGLAPHTSAGALGRIIGFTSAQVCYTHPFYHATKRRNCDGDEDGLMLLMDALLNFSYSYIPDKRGGKMDLPLLITTRLDPSEVDKEAHNLDTLARYPLKFYESTWKHEHSRTLESIMGCVSARLGTELQYEQFGFTHDTNDISEGPKESIYKTLKTMMEKMNLQLSLAAKIRAVDEADVAYKVIEQHFLPDIIGNLRAFSKQSVRCPTCNVTYRRIPLQGSCTKCGGKLTLTVHEMSVKKYLDISKEIAEKYNLPTYARQRISLVEKSIDSLFKSDKVKNTKLSDFF